MPSPSAARRVRLAQAESPDALWEHLVAPWLQDAAAGAWRDPLPTGVLVPSRGHGFYLHQRVVEAGFHLAGVHFWTPADLRLLLCRRAGLPEPAPPRDVRLLLGLAAEQAADARRTDRTAAAIAAEPAALLRAFDELVAAGWEGEGDRNPIAGLLDGWRALMDAEGLHAAAELDRRLLAACRDRPPVLARLLVAGFNGAHWASWNFLVAAAVAAARTDVGLLLPRPEAEELDMTWIGSWEQLFGDAATLDPPAAPRPAPFAWRVEGAAEAHPDIHLAANHRDEARAVVARALDYLQSPDCTRLGIAVPGPGALAREIGRLLRAADIPHDDAFGTWRPERFERADWRSWLEFQHAPSLEALLRFLQQAAPEVLEALAGGGDAMVTPAEMQRALRGAYREILLDDVRVLAEWMRDHPSARYRRVADLLRGIRVLPLRASYARHVEATEAAFKALGWTELAQALRVASGQRAIASRQPIGRGLFLKWLGEVAATWSRHREPGAGERYGRVHLLGMAEAEHRSWSHLILTSLTDGVWPPREESAAYIDKAEIDRLNAAIRAHNTASTGEGAQGLGHETVEPGRALCLGDAERRALAERQFAELCENTSHRLALTCRLGDETQPGTEFHPNEWVMRAYQRRTGRALSQERAETERRGTASWAEGVLPPEPAPAALPSGEMARFLQAHAARRDPAAAFGEYEFAYRAAPPAPVVLSASGWQRAVTQPALTWLGSELGVTAVDSLHAEDLLPQAVGTLCHRWMAAVGKTGDGAVWRPVPAADRWQADVLAAAGRSRSQVEGVLAVVKRRLPVWWTATWTEALHAARLFADTVAQWHEWERLATEFELPDVFHPTGPGGDALHIYGRLDLVLVRGLELDPAGAARAAACLAVDYKTGSVQALTEKSVRRGEGVQVALYALGLDAAGFGGTSMALLKPGEKPRALSAESAAALEDLWQGLAAMQQSGRFGMHGELRPEFQKRSPYPLATLRIDPEVLAAKWKQAHPAWEGALK